MADNNSQKIPSGYKQTEIGVIPADWDVKRLGDIVQFNNGKAHERFIDDKGDYIVVNSKFISTAGEVFKNSFENLSPLSDGDIAMVMSDIPNGKALAKCFFIEKNGKYTLNQRICAFKSNGSDSLYLFYKLNRNKYFLDFDSGVGQTNLKKSEVLDCPVALPADKKEQTSIATALSDADILIKKLEKLIEKKKNIRLGSMQELLTGKRRLAGFSGKWKIKKLGEVANVIGGGTPTTSVIYYWNGDINWFTPTEIGIDKYVYESRRKITIEGLKNSSAKILDEGTILLTSRAGIGDLAILKVKASTNQGFQSLVPINDTDSEFLYYLMLTKKDALLEKASGSTFLEISPNNVRAIELMMPEPTEQIAIATVLSDMDTEIEKLESQLTKYQNIKQGMMQTLLTGKIRLLTK